MHATPLHVPAAEIDEPMQWKEARTIHCWLRYLPVAALLLLHTNIQRQFIEESPPPRALVAAAWSLVMTASSLGAH